MSSNSKRRAASRSVETAPYGGAIQRVPPDGPIRGGHSKAHRVEQAPGGLLALPGCSRVEAGGRAGALRRQQQPPEAAPSGATTPPRRQPLRIYMENLHVYNVGAGVLYV